MTRESPRLRFPAVLLAVFAGVFLALGIDPHDRYIWWVENILVAIVLAILVASRHRFPLSRVSYALIFVFLCLHALATHYTYPLVPYERWAESLTGTTFGETLGWERNHFDRLAHFAFGLLACYPIREFYCRLADARGFWSYFYPVEMVMAASAAYEIFEWIGAMLMGAAADKSFLGAQGDIWDAQKDMALATVGALVAMLITVAINLRWQPDFHPEWQGSLTVKERRPLGEESLARMSAEAHARDRTGRVG